MVGPSPAPLENALIGDARCPTEPVKITIPLGGGPNTTINRTSIEIKRDKAIWRGPVQEAGPPLTLMWWPNGRMTGRAQDGSSLYSIRHLGDGIYTIIELNDQRMPSEHAPAPARLRNDPNLRDDPLLQQGDASVLRKSAPGTRPQPPSNGGAHNPSSGSPRRRPATSSSTSSSPTPPRQLPIIRTFSASWLSSPSRRATSPSA